MVNKHISLKHAFGLLVFCGAIMDLAYINIQKMSSLTVKMA